MTHTSIHYAHTIDHVVFLHDLHHHWILDKVLGVVAYVSIQGPSSFHLLPKTCHYLQLVRFVKRERVYESMSLRTAQLHVHVHQAYVSVVGVLVSLFTAEGTNALDIEIVIPHFQFLSGKLILTLYPTILPWKVHVGTGTYM